VKTAMIAVLQRGLLPHAPDFNGIGACL